MSHAQHPQLVTGAAIAVTLLLALCFPFIEWGLQASTPLFFAALRAAAGGAALLLIAAARRRQFPRQRSEWLKILAAALCATSVGYGAMFVGGGLVEPGLATVIANVQPLFAAVLAVWLLGERCGTHRALALSAAFVGVILLAGIDANWSPSTGATLLLLSALALAFGNILLKALAGSTDPIVVSGLQLSFGAPPLFFAAWFTGEPLKLPADAGFWLALLVLAGASTALAAVLWQWVLARAPLNQINAVSYLIPVYGLPLMLLNGVSIQALQWLGAGLVLLTVGLTLIPLHKNQ